TRVRELELFLHDTGVGRAADVRRQLDGLPSCRVTSVTTYAVGREHLDAEQREPADLQVVPEVPDKFDLACVMAGRLDGNQLSDLDHRAVEHSIIVEGQIGYDGFLVLQAEGGREVAGIGIDDPQLRLHVRSVRNPDAAVRRGRHSREVSRASLDGCDLYVLAPRRWFCRL